MNRCAPLPAPRDRGVLRTAAARRHPRDRARHVRVGGHARGVGSRRLRSRVAPRPDASQHWPGGPPMRTARGGNGKSGEARHPRRVPVSAFELPRVSSDDSCRLAHVVSGQPLLAASAEGDRREDRFPSFDRLRTSRAESRDGAPRRRRRDGTSSVPANSPRDKQSTVPRSKH
jgi:hypothetical protein